MSIHLCQDQIELQRTDVLNIGTVLNQELIIIFKQPGTSNQASKDGGELCTGIGLLSGVSLTSAGNMIGFIQVLHPFTVNCDE